MSTIEETQAVVDAIVRMIEEVKRVAPTLRAAELVAMVVLGFEGSMSIAAEVFQRMGVAEGWQYEVLSEHTFLIRKPRPQAPEPPLPDNVTNIRKNETLQ